MHFTVICEIDAAVWFDNTDGEDSPELAFCKENATFTHVDACEYILYIGPDGLNDDSYKDTRCKMQEAGLGNELLDAYEQAAEMGAVRLILYAV